MTMRKTRVRMLALWALKLERHGADQYISPARIAEITQHGTASTMSDIMRKLYQAGMVSRSPGRPHTYKITGAGLRQIGRFIEARPATRAQHEGAEHA